MKRTIALALSTAGIITGLGAVAQASPPNGNPNPDPNRNAVEAVCDHVPHHARAYELFDCDD